MGLGYTEEELSKYLEEYGKITVAQLKYSFGGTSQAHSKFLKKLVEQNKLHYTYHKGGGVYSLAVLFYPTGYRHCECSTCFEIIVGREGDYCDECIEAGCDDERPVGSSKIECLVERCEGQE